MVVVFGCDDVDGEIGVTSDELIIQTACIRVVLAVFVADFGVVIVILA